MAKILIEREGKEVNNRTYYNYFANVVIRGQDYRVNLVPPDVDTDKGGFKILDIVFGDAETAELVPTPFEMKDASGRVTQRGYTYTLRTVDEDGEVFECPIKPRRKSDATALKMAVKELSA